MMRKRKPKRRKNTGVGRLFLWTTILALLVSVGIIAGQRITMEENFAPIVSVNAPTPVLSSTARTSTIGDDADATPRPSLFSVYDALTGAEHRQASPRVVSPRPSQQEAPRRLEAPPSQEAAPRPSLETPETSPPSAQVNPPAENSEPPAEEDRSATPQEAIEVTISAAPSEPSELSDEPSLSPEEDTPSAELPSRYTLQIASHPTMERARAEMDRLREFGLQPHVVAAEVPGQGRFYRVRVGRFADLEEARSAQNQIRTDREIQAFVTPL